MWRLSTGLRNALLENKQTVAEAKHGTTFSYVAVNGNGFDEINDSDNGLAGFRVWDWVTLIGGANNGKAGVIESVAADKLEVSGAGLVAGAAGTAVIVASAIGGSFKGIFRDGVIRIFSGTQPTTADDAETGSFLCEVSLSSGAFTPGSSTNGINFGQTANGTIHKAVGEIWSGINVATGVAGWFRLYANDRTAGANADLIRMDGACATSGAQINLTSTSLVISVATTIDSVNLSMPAQ